MNKNNNELDWYIIVENGLYIGYTNSEYIANEYKRIGSINTISITKYQSPKDVVEKIVFKRYGGSLSEQYHIKPVMTPNKKLVVLTSDYRKDEYLYGMVDVSHEVDSLLISLYNIADILDYFIDGDKLRTVIKIMIIKYINNVISAYYDGLIFGDLPIDELYILAYNDAIVVIDKL